RWSARIETVPRTGGARALRDRSQGVRRNLLALQRAPEACNRQGIFCAVRRRTPAVPHRLGEARLPVGTRDPHTACTRTREFRSLTHAAVLDQRRRAALGAPLPDLLDRFRY